jgi:hypothetical protein
MTSEFEHFHFEHSLPEDSEELMSIVRTSDRISYEYWSELFARWRALRADSVGERQIHIHNTMPKENWAAIGAANSAEKVLLTNQEAHNVQFTKSADFKIRKEGTL